VQRGFVSEPVLVALLFADRVITENTNKKGIIGTFIRFFSPQFPAAFPPWAIYAAAANAAGEHDFALTLTHTETNQVVLPINGKFQAQTADDVIELTFNVANAVFPKEGKYVLTFHIDGELIGSRILFVELAKQSGG